MPPSFQELCERTRRIGVEKVAYPIDVFSAASEFSDHPDTRSNLKTLLELAEDPENCFTRWAAIRAIGLLGPSSIAVAREVLVRRLVIEEYGEARAEIQAALAKLDVQPT